MSNSAVRVIADWRYCAKVVLEQVAKSFSRVDALSITICRSCSDSPFRVIHQTGFGEPSKGRFSERAQIGAFIAILPKDFDGAIERCIDVKRTRSSAPPLFGDHMHHT